ncbi:MAG: GTPase protein [Proteobacteria bacterium]|nr:GTPase protein [Pseudomonadota bacterium]
MSDSEKVVLSPAEIDAKAQRLIKNTAWGSAGLGLVPVPVVDLVAIGGLQVWLVRELAKLHGVPLAGNRIKALVSALIGSGAPTLLATGTSSLVKAIPFVGPVLSLALSPSLSGVSTLALGRVFHAHFKTGGTLLDFDADKMRAYYEAELAKAKEEADAREKAEPAAAA